MQFFLEQKNLMGYELDQKKKRKKKKENSAVALYPVTKQ